MDHGSMDHGGMDMGGSGDKQCKIDMLFNVNTIGSCFFTKNFYIETHGQFAGACILTVLLVVALEALRRGAREYDRLITNKHVAEYRTNGRGDASPLNTSTPKYGPDGDNVAAPPCSPIPALRPSLVQQGIRALLHMFQFGTAYIIMLLAMYYNGYILVCIVLGAFIGYFAFNWEPLAVSGQPNGTAESTVCCG